MAADRHADEEGRLHCAEVDAERWIEDMVEDFDDGFDNRFVDFDSVLDAALSEGRIQELIKHAWMHRLFTQLGAEIQRELTDIAEQQLYACRPDIEAYLLRNPDPDKGDAEVP
jgi:hypothetical protein